MITSEEKVNEIEMRFERFSDRFNQRKVYKPFIDGFDYDYISAYIKKTTRYFELKAKGITTEAEALEHRELLNKINEMVGVE